MKQKKEPPREAMALVNASDSYTDAPYSELHRIMPTQDGDVVTNLY